MISKIKEREEVIKLRRQGLSYREILERIPVAKSTLSLWLRSVTLSKKQQQHLTRKKFFAQKRGAATRKKRRLELTERIKDEAHRDVGKILKKEFWLLGAMLYWGEGTKEKEHRPSGRVALINMDPRILKIFQKWLLECCNVPHEDIQYELYLHRESSSREGVIRKYWYNQLKIPKSVKIPVYYKKSNPKTHRRNTRQQYQGSLRINVRRSTNLNRRIAGWIEGVYDNIAF